VTPAALAEYQQTTGGTLPGPRLLKDPARQLIAVMVLQALATTTTSVSRPVSAEWPVLLRDPNATGVWVGEIRSTLNAAAMLDEIKSLSGLTWEQLANIVGVSRRTIHLWLQGNSLSHANEERLHSILHIVRSLSGSSQLDVRSRMLDKSGGSSVAELLKAHDDDAAAALARQRALTHGAPDLFEHATNRSREVLDARRTSVTATDLLEPGTSPVQTTAAQPKRVRRMKRGTADDR
jgi:transcriptional regulator with XRE-family HTH domain